MTCAESARSLHEFEIRLFMNHTDIFILIINILFSDGFATFLLLSIGLYRLIDGINRVKFENKIDNRIDLIPDKNVYFFWLRISHLNLHFGKFFILYGIILMILGLINLIVDNNSGSDTPIINKNTLILVLLWLIGFLIVRNNGWQPGEAYGLRYMRQKKQLFEYYKSQNFKPLEEWDMVKLLSVTSKPEIAAITVKDVTTSNFKQKLTPYGFYLYYLSSFLMVLIYILTK